MTRAVLPNRRSHEAFDFEHRGSRWTAGIGRYPDGSLAEVFLDCSKASSDVADDGHDTGIALSFALQHGAPIQALAKSVAREPDGSPIGITGRFIDAFAAYEAGSRP